MGLLAVAVPLAFGSGGASPVSITVTAGKPTEYLFTLSKRLVLTGTVAFKVVNAGKVPHGFTIAGQQTPVLAPGHVAKLTVVFSKPGAYPFSSTIKSQTARGMKGVFAVSKSAGLVSGAAVQPNLQTSPESDVGAPCASPTSTTVSIKMYEFGFLASPSTIPCGSVTFNVSNIGQIMHNFDVEVVGASGTPVPYGGKQLLPNESTTVTVNYTRTGTFRYSCDLHFQDYSMGGSLKVV